MNPLRAACALAAPALLLGLLAAPPAAATETSTGVRCTIVGTAGDDLLVGTSARDVICGRGGDDVIRSRAGNDLVDSGDGSDVVRAGDGADRVLAGPGPDDVFGGTGADDLTGGRGADDLSGDGGSDEVEGGYGDDDLEGGGSGDELDGQGGDDHLDGEGGGDDLDGGVGTNMCIVDAADESVRCKYDEAPPVLVETRIAPAVVDVTDAPAEVTLRVRATDDTGVDDVQVQLYGGNDYDLYLDVPEHLQLESGTARDGWWATTFEVPRYTSPAVFRPEVMLRDRLGRSVSDPSSPQRLEVLDANPDTTTPQLELLAPLDSEPVDVRTKGADVTVSVRGTDDLSGVGRVDLCLARLMDVGYSTDICQEAVPRTTGTARNGTWTATLGIPKGAPSGVWNVYTHAWDRVWNDVRFLGPDAYRSWVERRVCCGSVHPFDADAGALTVIGAEDRTAAWTDSVVVSPTRVDTYQSDATTHVTVRARDVAGEGVTSVMAILVSESDLATAPQFTGVDLVRTAGDLEDGTWEGDLLLPRSTPPGTYHVAALVNDITHSTWFVGPSYPGESTGYQRLDHDPVVVVEDTRPPAG